MEWLGNRHAGEPSPARLLKIPSQKGVGEVGGEGVFGAADRVGSSILTERAGGVRAGVGEAHADAPAAVVDAAADLRRHRLPVGHRGHSPEVHRNVRATMLNAGSRKGARRESVARFEGFHLHAPAVLRQSSSLDAAGDFTAATFAATTPFVIAALAAALAAAALARASIRARLDERINRRSGRRQCGKLERRRGGGAPPPN